MLALLLFGTSQQSLAVDTSWDAGISGWNIPGNWDTANAPTAVDNVFIDNGGTAQIGGGIDAVANDLIVGNTSTCCVITGILEISDGGTLSTGSGILGKGSISVAINLQGRVTVDGPGSTWTNTGDLTVGESADGRLTISDGGVVSVAGDMTLAKNPSSSSDLIIGDGGAAGILNTTSVNGGDGSNAGISFNHSDANYFFTNDGTNTGTAIVISGNMGVSHSGPGTTTLSGANTYSRNTSVSSGTLSLGSDTAAGTGSFLFSGGIIDYTDGVTIANQIILVGAPRQLQVLTGRTATQAGQITQVIGSPILEKIGNGTLILSGNNTYTGGTTVSGGILQGTTTSLQGNITNNSNVTFDQTTNGTYAGVLSGTGSLTKSNTGTVILSGTNTYSGATTISAGTLQISTAERIDNGSNLVINGGNFDLNSVTETVANLSGTGGNINIGAGGNGNLIVNQTVDQAYAGNFSGNSNAGTTAFTKNGAATLTLSGTNTQTGRGSVRINAGRLTVQNGNAIGDNQAINGTGGEFELLSSETVGMVAFTGNILLNGNTLTINGDGIAGVLNTNNIGVISGNGGLIIDNDVDVQRLSGTNTYTGTTTINGGTLQTNNISALGNNSAVTVNAGSLELISSLNIGSLAGTGGVTLNTNTLTTGNDNTSTAFSGVLSGTGGALSKQGTGTLTLTGTNTYTGATAVNAGTLSVNGSIASSTTTVNTGGTLGGTGTVGSVNINGGTFAPGNSIGTTNVTGNVDFTGGGNYNVEVNAAGASDLINATGSAILTSGIVNVQPEAGDYGISTDYTILTAAGGLGGTEFASVNSNLAFLTPTLTYDATNVFLNLTRNNVNFSSVANTPNQTAVSTVLGNNEAALQDIASNLLVLTTTGAQQAFDSLSGVQYTHGQVLTNKLGQQFLQLLFNRGSQNPKTPLSFNSIQQFDPLQGHLLADNSNNWQQLETESSSLVASQRGWWLQGFGSFGDIDDTANASGADYDTKGFAFGVDTEWRNLIVGLAGSYARSDADTFGGNLDIDSYQMAGYGRWQRDALYMNAALGFGFHLTDASRAVIIGATTSTATADYDSYTVSAGIEAGKDMALSPATTFTPFVGVEYTHSQRDAFTETGAGSANLTVNDQDQDSLRTKLGVRLSKDIKTKHNKTITPSASLAYVREYMDNVSRMEAGFTAVPTSTFQIDGSDLDRDRLQIGLGVSGQLNDRTTLNLGYNGEWADSDTTHSVSAKLKVAW